MKLFTLLSLILATVLHLARAEDASLEDVIYTLEFPGEIYDDGELFVDSANESATNYNAVVGNANNYLDNLLQQAKANFGSQNIDPLPLDNVEKSFKKGKIIKLKGGFTMKNGQLRGLLNLHRSGDATLETLGDRTIIQATMAVNDLKVQMDARAYFSKLSTSWYMGAKVKYLRAYIRVEVPHQAGVKPKVTNFDIREIGTISVDVKKLGPLNWVIEGLGYLVTNMLKNVMKGRLSKMALKALN